MLLGLLVAGSAGGQVVQPVAPAVPAAKLPFKLDSSANIVVHANSYYAKWVYEGIETISKLGELIRSSGATASNFAIPGTTWSLMTLSDQRVVDAYKPGKTNILLCGETRNQAFELGSIVTDYHELVRRTRLYIAAVQADTIAKHGKGWDYVVLCGTIGTQDFSGKRPAAQVLAGNKALSAYDEWMRDKSNLASVGADYFVDFRKHNPAMFDGDGVDRLPGFMSQPGVTVMEREAGTFVHPIGSAREAFAKCIADGITEYSAR